MNIDIRYQPAYSLAIVGLGPDESIQAEAGAMVSMTSNIEVETSMKGGLLGAVTRSVLGGETLFANTFTSRGGAGEITLSGSAEVLDFKSSGAAKLHARDLAAQRATIDCSGAAKVEVNASQELNVALSGAGRVSYAGDPHLTQSISGAGKVERAE